jgi:spermidine/putrescine transport system permease protein
MSAQAPTEPRQRLLIRIGKKVLSLHALLTYLFLYVPILVLIIFSFNDSKSVFKWAGFTIKWYLGLFHDPRIMGALKNSLIVAFASMIVSTVFGTMVSIALERYHFFGKLPLDALLYLPIVIPEITMAVMLLVFFVLIRLSLGLHTIIISHIAFNISFVTVTVRARLAGLDPAFEEAAQDLYANEWQTFWKVTFPLLLPGIIGGALMAFTLSLDDYVITFFTAGARSTTLPLRIYSMIKTGVKPDINALSSLMLMVSMVLVILSLLLQRKGGEGGTIK